MERDWRSFAGLPADPSGSVEFPLRGKAVTLTETPRKSLVRSSGGSLLASVVILLFNVVSGVVLARTLGPSSRGALAAIVLWAGLIAYVGNMGLPGAVLFFVARDREDAASIAATGLTIALLLGGLAAAAGALAMPFLMRRFGPDIRLIATVYVVTVPLNITALTGAASLQGASRFRLFNALRLLPVVASAVTLLGLAAVGRLTVATGSYLYISIAIANVVVTVWFLRMARLLRGIGRRELVRPILVYGFKAHTGTLSGVANDRADQALISLFMNGSALGFYSAAIALSAPILVFGTSFSVVGFPSVAALKLDPAAQGARAARLIRTTFLLSALASVLLMPMIPFLIRIFLGPAFEPATIAAAVLLVATAVGATKVVSSSCLNAMGHPLQSGYGEMIAAAVTIVGLVVLLPIAGIVGAAVTSVVAYAAACAYIINRIKRYTGTAQAEFVLPRRSDVDWVRAALFRNR